MSTNEACPYCGSENIEEYEQFLYDGGGDVMVDSQKCNDCGERFLGIYHFSHYEDTMGKTIGYKVR
jgi:YgiT-type zinc finger domain-containing protein